MILMTKFDENYDRPDFTDPASVKAYLLSGHTFFNFEKSKLIVPVTDGETPWIYDVTRCTVEHNNLAMYLRECRRNPSSTRWGTAYTYWANGNKINDNEIIDEDKIDELCVEIAADGDWIDGDNTWDVSHAFGM